MLALIDNQGHVLSPLTVAPVNEVDMGLLPQGLRDLKRVAREVGLEVSGAVLNLEAGFDSKAHRKAVFTAGLKPNIKENPRNRQKPKQGRRRFFDAVLYHRRFTVERTFAWLHSYRRVMTRYERRVDLYDGFVHLALAFICLNRLVK